MSKIRKKFFSYIKSFLKLHNKMSKLPLGQFKDRQFEKTNLNNKVLIFSPHPDDECVIGGLPLRLMKEKNFTIKNIAMTLGSNKQRQEERKQELIQACKSLNFEPIFLKDNNNYGDLKNKVQWQNIVNQIKKIIIQEKAKFLFFPHHNDYHITHIAVHQCVKHALEAIFNENKKFQTITIETEFWQMMDNPNILVEISNDDLAHLMFALSLHKGEVESNPYHIKLCARAFDNVLRGSEVVLEQGAKIQKMNFAMIYKISQFKDGKYLCPFNKGIAIEKKQSLNIILDLINNEN